MFSKEAQFSKPLTIPPAWYTFLLPAKVYAVLHGHVLTSSRGQWLRNALPRISPRSAFPSAIESPQKPWLQQELKILYEVLSTVWYANPEWKDSAKNQNKLQRRKKKCCFGDICMFNSWGSGTIYSNMQHTTIHLLCFDGYMPTV